MEHASELTGLGAKPESSPNDFCDSPPSRRQTSRWQQLKAGWTESSSAGGVGIDQGHDCTSPASKLQILGSLIGNIPWHLSSEHQEGADLIAAADTDVAGILQRCADIQHAAQQEHSGADISNSIQPTAVSVPRGYSGSLNQDNSASGVVGSALLPLLSDPASLQNIVLPESAESPNQQQLQQALDQPQQAFQQQGQQDDMAGAFDHLLGRQQQQQSMAHMHSHRMSTARGSGQPLPRHNTSTGAGTIASRQSNSTSRAQHQGKVSTAASAGGRAAPAQQAQRLLSTNTIRHSSTTVSRSQVTHTAAPAVVRTSDARRTTGARASTVQQTKPTPSGRALAPISSPQKAVLSRPNPMPAAKHPAYVQPTVTGRPATTTASRSTGSRISLVTTTGQQLAQAAAGQAAMCGSLQEELSASSRMSSNSSSSMRACQADLQLELAAVWLFRLLRRWRLAAAEVAVDKARARPMYNLLSKRKVLRAWKMAHTIQNSSNSDCSPHQQPMQPQQQSLLQSQPAPQQQPQRLQHHRQTPQQQQPQLSSQLSQEALKRLQVACQFHRLYRQHCCLLHWQAWAAAAAQARRQLQQQEQLQQRQRALAQQQEELLAEFQRRQQQELLQQQEQARLHVAQRFHTLYMLHASLRTWHKHASISAALRKLHPTMPLVQAAVTGANAGVVCEGTEKHSSGRGDQCLAQTGGAERAVHCTGSDSSSRLAVGLLDPAVMQQKAQLLLQHLANRAAGGAEQQQSAPECIQPQGSDHTKLQKQQQQKPQGPQHTSQQRKQKPQQQQQEGLTAKATRPKNSSTAVILSTGAPLPHLNTIVPADMGAAKQQVQQQAPLPLQQQAPLSLQQQQQQEEADVDSSGTGGPLQETAKGAAQQALETDQGDTSTNALTMSAADVTADQEHKSAAAPRPSVSAADATVMEPTATVAYPLVQKDSTAAPRPSMSVVHATVMEPTATVSKPAVQPGADAAAAVVQVSTQDISSSNHELQRQQGSVACSEPREPGQEVQVHEEQQVHKQQQDREDKDGQRESQVTGDTANGSPMLCLEKDRPVQQPQEATTAHTLQQQGPQKGQQQDLQKAHKQVQQQPQQQQQKRQPEQVQQQQQQLEWPQERQRLQQQIRQLQAEEQRRHRQYQQVEQQLQAVLTQQLADLAAVHATRVLVRRAGLGPWMGLMKLKGQQWKLAGRLYQWHLLNTAMGGLRHAVLCRHKRHTCAHIQAYGKLRAVRQQQQQSGALSALWTWSLTGRHYRGQLILRCMKAWRVAAAEGAAVMAGVTGALRALRTHQVLAAWWGYVQGQAHQHLLIDLELTAVADGWRAARLQRCVLLTWREHTAAATRQRLQEAAHQQTWSRVRGWLTELDGGEQGAGNRVPSGPGEAVRGSGCGLAAAIGPLAAPDADAIHVSSNGLHSGVWGVGELPAGAGGAGPTEVPDWDDWSVDVDGNAGLDGQGGAGVVGSEAEADGHDAFEDLAALTEWFEAVGRDLDAAS